MHCAYCNQAQHVFRNSAYTDGACVLRMGPGCFQRDTRLNGLRQVPLCPARHYAVRPERDGSMT
jgi:hypothetical protein